MSVDLRLLGPLSLDDVLHEIQARIVADEDVDGIVLTPNQEAWLLGEWRGSNLGNAPDALDGTTLWGQRVSVRPPR